MNLLKVAIAPSANLTRGYGLVAKRVDTFVRISALSDGEPLVQNESRRSTQSLWGMEWHEIGLPWKKYTTFNHLRCMSSSCPFEALASSRKPRRGSKLPNPVYKHQRNSSSQHHTNNTMQYTSDTWQERLLATKLTTYYRPFFEKACGCLLLHIEHTLACSAKACNLEY